MTAKTFNTILLWIKTYQTGAELEDYSHILSPFENENSKIIIQNANYIVVVKLGELVRKFQYRIYLVTLGKQMFLRLSLICFKCPSSVFFKT